ncbi:MAG TPA: ferritin-like domain-containing protein [Nocardioides sp.]|uniref:ferritin-like domain-containing protein n=1 Tax=Nocardioides sp. TaxID=35761 RepID=UPI002C7ABAC7|nr:ferritin-like domain-containing protein [Nocardioides sp.]HQR25694.1 ferritin-like domain-containing protein [Nocardioides sp.]
MTEAQQATLAAEHAAVYTYGVLGGRASALGNTPLQAQVSAAYGVHRARRDALVRAVRDQGGEPVAAAPAYDVTPMPVTTAQVRRSAQEVEAATAEAYASLVAATTGGQREWAVQGLTDAAVREVGFGAAPEAFPGAGELGSR